ncbi:MAG: FAD-dependent oxidoreductase [Oscillospiraceae bacterium]|nr:FAD-dependent oxidoreductase [Oscillospiraceae bacterium]
MALTKYPHVYQPIQVGNMTLKNRIQYSPIVTNHADYESGRVTHEMLEFVSGQGKTGASLVTIGSTPVNFEEARDFYGCLSATNDHDVPGLTMLANELHKYDCKLSAELIHGGQWGAMTLPEGRRAWVPSIVAPYHEPAHRFQEITRTQMLTVIDDFVAALKRCMAAKFDMAMIHYAHGNLMSGFLSTLWNQRGDKYGGSEQNRWRFPLELLEAAYGTVKGRMPLEMRVVGNEYLPGGTTLEERIRFMKEAQRYIDMIVVSAGNLEYGEAFSYNMPNYYIPAGVNVPYAAAFKEACPDLVVSVVGGISTLEHAEEVIKSGKADIVAMAKALMADGDFVNKGARGLEADIKPCLRCMYCLREFGPHLNSCAVNPSLGWEYRGFSTPLPALKKKKVMIIGGGPGGMAAATYLTERGHEITLYEQGDKLGGRLPEAGALSFKDGFRRYAEYAVRKTKESGAKIVLGKKADAAAVRAESPDTLIIAVGAEPIRLDIKGIDGPNVKDVSVVDRKETETGSQVVVCGAGLSGTECALALAMEGRDVTLVDTLTEDQFYSDMRHFSRPTLTRLLAENNVKLMPECAVQEFTNDGVTVRKADGGEVKIPCDTAVIAFGLKPDKGMIDELNEIVPETYVIGDAIKAGVMGDAIGSAFWATREI